ncbi:MAG TPA: hypothetical protein PLU72_19555 [Candidatus Ozemobacteraceae bacterium]|nr:hypothetical protein [Candidatus Ozemobacteraceae bacterium]HQG27239.1 hypothetical protein [Candidatus Ozemobacteraceae bacterium]
MTTREGPSLELLLRRLAETPYWFLRTPGADDGPEGGVDLTAVLRDLLLDLGCESPDTPALQVMKRVGGQTERGRIALVLAWLLHDGYFLERRGAFVDGALAVLREIPGRFTGVVRAERFVTEPDRREELARLSLKLLGLRPAGETDVQAADRLVSLDSVERANIVREARAAEKRAREIREAMARKAAEEAAATYGRE